MAASTPTNSLLIAFRSAKERDADLIQKDSKHRWWLQVISFDWEKKPGAARSKDTSVTWINIKKISDGMPPKARFLNEVAAEDMAPIDANDIVAKQASAKWTVEKRKFGAALTINKYPKRVEVDDNGAPTNLEGLETSEFYELMAFWSEIVNGEVEHQKKVGKLVTEPPIPAGAIKCPTTRVCGIVSLYYGDSHPKFPNGVKANPCFRLKFPELEKNETFAPSVTFLDGTKRTIEVDPSGQQRIRHAVALVDGEPITPHNVHKWITWGSHHDGLVEFGSLCLSQFGISLSTKMLSLVSRPRVNASFNYADDLYSQDEIAQMAIESEIVPAVTPAAAAHAPMMVVEHTPTEAPTLESDIAALGDDFA